MARTLRVMLALPPCRILVISLLIVMPTLCLCGRFCRVCREQGQDPPMDHEGPPERPSIVPAESIRVSTSDSPPPYDEVGVYPNPCSAP